MQSKHHSKPNRKVDNLERSTLLKKANPVRKNLIPFSVTYTPTLPNIREIINKHWHILNINNTVRNVFKATLVIAFRINTSLRQIIGTNTIRQPKTSEGQVKCD